MANAAENLADAAHEAGEYTEEALRRRASELQRFFDDVEELLRKVANVSDADIARMRRRIESSISGAKSFALDGVDYAVDGTRRAAKVTDEYVHENPWTAIGVSAAAGLLVGALLCRR